MKRVLIFALTYHPFIGGAEIAIKEITQRCDAREYSFDLITLWFDANLPRQEKVGNVMVHRVGFAVPGAKVSDRTLPWQCKLAKALFPFTAFFKALSLQRGKGFDSAWAMMANQAGFAALIFAWMYPHLPFFLELQDGRPFAEMKQRRPILRALWPLYRAIYLNADIIKVIGSFLVEEVRMIGYAGPVELIPNGVDFRKFSEPIEPVKLDALKVQYSKQPGDVFLFTASRLVLSRGVEDVIEALSQLPPNVKFLIAGAGEDREKLEHIARGLGVLDRCMFAGQVAPDEIPAHLQVSDIFVRPSIIEAFGSAFVEAMAAGIPIIGTPVGGIPDFLKNGETGLFCGVHDPKSIAVAVEEYLADPAMRERVVATARERAAATYDWDLIAHDVRKKIFEPI